jgi:hypothetical protein
LKYIIRPSAGRRLLEVNLNFANGTECQNSFQMSDRPPPEFVLQRQGPPIIRPSHLFSLIVGLAAAGLIALFAVDSYEKK